MAWYIILKNIYWIWLLLSILNKPPLDNLQICKICNHNSIQLTYPQGGSSWQNTAVWIGRAKNKHERTDTCSEHLLYRKPFAELHRGKGSGGGGRFSSEKAENQAGVHICSLLPHPPFLLHVLARMHLCQLYLQLIFMQACANLGTLCAGTLKIALKYPLQTAANF